MTISHSEPIDPNTLGAQANALVERFAEGQFVTRLGRHMLHGMFLELLVRIANLEARETEREKVLRAAMNAGNDGYRALRELTELATAVVEANNSGSVAPYGVALNELAAHLKEKP